MQSSLIAFSAIFVVLLCVATGADVLPAHRERRAPSDDLQGFEPDTWEEADDEENYRTAGIAKRIADNDFATMRHMEMKNHERRHRMLQTMNEMLAKAGKRSMADKRSLAQNDYMMARQDLAEKKLYITLLDRMLTEAGKR